MRKVCLFILIFLSANRSFAAYYSAEISDVLANSDGSVLVGLSSLPPTTCTNWIWHFRFDGSTQGGKNMFGVLLAAKMAGKSVHVWYSESTNPGTNQTNGCTNSTMAVLQSVSVRSQ